MGIYEDAQTELERLGIWPVVESFIIELAESVGDQIADAYACGVEAGRIEKDVEHVVDHG